jgi:hypothetical protein
MNELQTEVNGAGFGATITLNSCLDYTGGLIISNKEKLFFECNIQDICPRPCTLNGAKTFQTLLITTDENQQFISDITFLGNFDFIYGKARDFPVPDNDDCIGCIHTSGGNLYVSNSSATILASTFSWGRAVASSDPTAVESFYASGGKQVAARYKIELFRIS